MVEFGGFQKAELAVDLDRDGKPQLATKGHFSDTFYKRVLAAVKLAPAVTEHVVAMITASGGSEDRVDGTREAPLPMSVQAFADANEIYSLFVYWTKTFASELKVQAPGPAQRAWRNERGTIVGLPSNITPADARYLVGIMATWLDVHLEQIMGVTAPDVVEFEQNLKTIFQVNARWPQRQRPRFSDMPCPDDKCGGKIAVYPPELFGDDEKIICTGCGRIFMPIDYERLVGVFKQLRAEMVTGAKVTTHLTEKYGAA